MKIRVLSQDDVRAAMDMRAAIEEMRRAFAALSSGDAEAPVRLALEHDRGVHLFMPAQMRTRSAVGAKVVSVNPGNRDVGLPMIHAVVLALDPDTGRPLALMDGTYLTALRTGAAGGLAADLLARSDASVVALFGAGVQARTQLQAVRCVRAIEEVRIVSKPIDSACVLAEEVRDSPDAVRAIAVDDPATAIRGADIIVTATDSAVPVFEGAGVEPGTHVTGVGSYQPSMREVDADLIRRARIIVDQREAALAEAGDLAGPIEDGVVGPDAIAAELGEVVLGSAPGRTSPEEITFFKSVGNAVQDVAVAATVLEVAEREGLGTLVDL